MTYTLYHNPACSTSRKVLELLREAGVPLRVVEYLKTPPSRDELTEIIRRSGGSARDFLRDKEPICQELGLKTPEVSDAHILEAILAHPVLLNRPIVVTDTSAVLCRPAERVRELFL